MGDSALAKMLAELDAELEAQQAIAAADDFFDLMSDLGVAVTRSEAARSAMAEALR